MGHSNSLSLFELSQRIKQALDNEFVSTLWVIGEISDIKENISGHCYLELVEKESSNDFPKAKARGTIWARSYRMIKPFFESATGRKLGSGIKVLVQCTVNYHPIYGLSLNIIDIDPAFTIGDIEMARQETINKLISEGVFNMNKEVPMPLLPKNIAVISSPTAAGFEDFTNQLFGNPYQYAFNVKLFAATMQGDNAEESIIGALDRIYSIINSWDVVVIIRGGGSQLDLNCFDSYQLVSNIAQFPIPIITGIGHERDVTVADMVAHTRQKTPTAVAEFLINQFENAENWLIEANDNFMDAVKLVLDSHVQSLSTLSNRITPAVLRSTKYENIKLERVSHSAQEATTRLISKEDLTIERRYSKFSILSKLTISKYQQTLSQSFKSISSKPFNLLDKEQKYLVNIDKTINALDPVNVLKRGYSITLFNGKALINSQEVKKGDQIETLVSSGKISSTVSNLSNS
jgi:exodeoxyribonuclease VII large subunit